MKHTPTPWETEKTKRCTWIQHPDESRPEGCKIILKIADTCCDAEAQANAEFIVEACNAYERLKKERGALLKALKAAKKWAVWEDCLGVLDDADKAITLCEAKEAP